MLTYLLFIRYCEPSLINNCGCRTTDCWRMWVWDWEFLVLDKMEVEVMVEVLGTSMTGAGGHKFYCCDI